MPFDIFTMAAIRDELTDRVVGARVDKVIQTSEHGIALRVWSQTWAGSIVLSADARNGRVYASQAKLSKGLETPPPFLMLLRKYCTGARVVGVEQVYLDRIILISLAHHERGTSTLLAEIMGNRSNLILVSGSFRLDGVMAGQEHVGLENADKDIILGALKLIGPRQSRTRRIAPHFAYEPPREPARPAAFGGGPKLDPLETESLPKLYAALGQIPQNVSLTDALVALLRGCSPSVAREVVGRIVGPETKEAIMAAIANQYELLQTRTWKPIVMVRDGVPVDYRAYEQPPVEGSELAEGMSAAVERVSAGLESTDALSSTRRRIRTTIATRRSEIQARLASLRMGLESAGAAEELLESGNMVLGFQYQIEPGQSILEVPESDRTIVVDPNSSPVENAERYFKRYRKAREAAKRLPGLVAIAETDGAFVDELDAFVDFAETPSDLVRLEAELLHRFPRRMREPGRRPMPRGTGKILTVRLPDGSRILVGRSAGQNEELTFKLAGRSDLWLHARDVPGAHVVLKLADRPADESAATSAAAELAAYYSKARNDSAVDVIVARVRDVHRVPGGAPGQVTVKNSRTVRARPAVGATAP